MPTVTYCPLHALERPHRLKPRVVQGQQGSAASWLIPRYGCQGATPMAPIFQPWEPELTPVGGSSRSPSSPANGQCARSDLERASQQVLGLAVAGGLGPMGQFGSTACVHVQIQQFSVPCADTRLTPIQLPHTTYRWRGPRSAGVSSFRICGGQSTAARIVAKASSCVAPGTFHSEAVKM